MEECQRLVDCAKADHNPQIHAFILIGLHTAMRRMEILRLRRDDVDTAGRRLWIRRAKAGARDAAMTRELADFLVGYLASLPAESPWLFPSTSSATGHTMEVRKPYRRVVAAAGLDPDLVLRHTLRHTAITHAVQAGVDLLTVKKISGHKTLAMVERYAHANTAHVQAPMDKLEARYKKVA